MLLHGDGIICSAFDSVGRMSILRISHVAKYVRAIIGNYHT